MPVALLGVGKGLVGLAVRPTMGLLEMTSKGTYGMGLVCLGREAISGSTLRRVRAPGALAEDSSEVPFCACSPLSYGTNYPLSEIRGMQNLLEDEQGGQDGPPPDLDRVLALGRHKSLDLDGLGCPDAAGHDSAS